MCRRISRNVKTLGASVMAIGLLLSATACNKKVSAPAPPAPVAKAPEAPPAPPPPAAARITNFSAEPRSIQRGQSATLTWSVANATEISIDNGVGTVQANGTRQITPNNATSYTLTARGPGGTDTRTVTVDVTAPPAPPPPAPAAPKLSGAEMLSREGGADVLFGYDKSDIRDDARQVLLKDADLLKRIFAADPGFSVILEGNCDERGSAEYNLGLGDRRSTSAKDFLVQQGVPADKLRTISYGKDRPVCTEASEDCYQRNRRVHLAPGQ
jgi:peptidoglycan-associated lipoprotein